MEKTKIPVISTIEPNPLWEKIRKFSRRKYGLAVLLVFIGMLGLIIPVIPGLLLIVFAVALFKPGLMAKIRKKINSIF